MNIKQFKRYDGIVPTNDTGVGADRTANKIRHLAAQAKLGDASSFLPKIGMDVLKGISRLMADPNAAKFPELKALNEAAQRELHDRAFGRELQKADRVINPPIVAEVVKDGKGTGPEDLYLADY